MLAGTQAVRAVMVVAGVSLLILSLAAATGAAPGVGSVLGVNGCVTSVCGQKTTLELNGPNATLNGLAVNFTVSGSFSVPLGDTLTFQSASISLGGKASSIPVGATPAFGGTFTLPRGQITATAPGSYQLSAKIVATVATASGPGVPPTTLSATSAPTLLTINGGKGSEGGCVNCPGVYAGFSYVAAGLNATFTGFPQNSGTPVQLTYTWSFGDGTTGVGTVVSHKYPVGATFPVTLTVVGIFTNSSNYGSTATATQNVTVGLANSTSGSTGTSSSPGFALNAPLGLLMGFSIALILVGAVPRWEMVLLSGAITVVLVLAGLAGV